MPHNRMRSASSLVLSSLVLLAGCTLFRRDPVETPPAAPMCAAGQPYFEFQVERPARFLADSVLLAPGTPYPSHAAPRGPDTVTVNFVVGTDGRPEVDTFRGVRVTNPALFVEARAAAEQWRYTPARLGKCPVRQLVQSNIARYAP